MRITSGATRYPDPMNSPSDKEFAEIILELVDTPSPTLMRKICLLIGDHFNKGADADAERHTRLRHARADDPLLLKLHIGAIAKQAVAEEFIQMGYKPGEAEQVAKRLEKVRESPVKAALRNRNNDVAGRKRK